MSISLEEVYRVATLARLRLTPEEAAQMQQQLSNILGHFEALQEVRTNGVPPTSQVLGLTSVLRPDVAQPILSRDEALANAPDQRGGMFRVKGVFDEAP